MPLLTEQLNSAIMKSKNSEIHFKEKMRDKLVETVRLTDETQTEDDILLRLEESHQVEDFCSESILGLTKEAKKQLDEITGRYTQLRQLEDDIQELADLFKEMQELVDLQGYKVDKVEQKIVEVQRDVHAGVDRLRQAREYFDRAVQKKRLLATIAVAVAILLMIIIISSSLPQSSSSVDNPAPAPAPTTATTTTSTTTPDPDYCDPDTDDMCVG